jgi:hypothetical protein
MTDPITSRYQTDPWQPTVNTSASDAGDEKSAAKKYDAIYGGSYQTGEPATPGSGSSNKQDNTVYPLSMAYTTAPEFIPVPSSKSSSSGTQPADSTPFYVELGTLRSTEQTFLDATSAAVDGYQQLSSVVENAISSNSVFGQIVGSEELISHGNMKVESILGGGTITVNYNQLDAESKKFAAAVIPQMKHLLAAVDGTVEAMGQFTTLLNNAGQMYTDTDAQSAFPPIA